ncbi:endo alpha-1,4 polygalactosaminidase [Jiangella anatolica]|uniref:endo alpha-1,4 polygalactosaminidase n=1 Tax=Jiangella anatolica TaxID=2670374 RepID=UPI0018F485B7|nr:endo alpha-1,4 polygalactosaminidase [Jiangella anatolica]
MRRILLVAALLALFTGCGDGGDGVVLPPAGGRVDYQLGGAYPPADGVDVVIRDVTAEPAPDAYGVCYVNAFQTQPGTLRQWQDEHGELLLRDDGELVADPDWPDEVLLDTSTQANRATLADVVGADLERCADAGYDAVEPDNLDSWTRSRGLIDDADNLAFARLLAGRAHDLGLAIAQKNAPELRDAGLDFAIAEECEVHDECDVYTEAYGRHVIEIEYTDNGTEAFQRACAARGDEISVLLRDRDVVPAGADGHVLEWC